MGEVRRKEVRLCVITMDQVLSTIRLTRIYWEAQESNSCFFFENNT
jgi:hypothetical protein